MKIFLSHTYTDKPVIEPIALRLREIFGQDDVFYDAWSIQPGDGIIDKMNEGLAAPDFVFFFVSAASLQSNMVKIEWQNALYASTKGRVRIIPVRVDGSDMPALMTQNVWIDLYAHGIEVAIQQIVSVIQGQNTFTPQHQGFSNLTYSLTQNGAIAVITISASHLLEPNPRFAIATYSAEGELECKLTNNAPSMNGFTPAIGKTDDGRSFNGFTISPLGGAITPKMPLRIELHNKGSKRIEIVSVLHNDGENSWRPLPLHSA
ncbi:TIR domain-containing protein [Sinorhizobium meliloti]|nr:TIR domain-containing protein [Sinorhizobium meliloti]